MVTMKSTSSKELLPKYSNEIEKVKLINKMINVLQKWQIRPKDGIVRTEGYKWNSKGKQISYFDQLKFKKVVNQRGW